nr:polymorphic toxin-type HINT domain-containing protein [Paludisphaera mucosa]
MDIGGIFEPTPFCDLASTTLAGGRGEYKAAFLSFLGVIPYLGDAANAGKFGTYIQSVYKAMDLAVKNSRFMALIRPIFTSLCKMLDTVPINKLLESIARPLEFIRGRLKAILGGCFAAGTPLLTPEGEKRVEDFRPGDWVLSAPEDDPDGTPQPRLVQEVFEDYLPLLELRIGSASIKTTAEHPFWVEGRGWTPANMLLEGDRLRTHDGSTVILSGVGDLAESGAVYNLRVADYHTYFVGSSEWGCSVWAHNSCTGPSALKAGDVSEEFIKKYDFGAHLKRIIGDPRRTCPIRTPTTSSSRRAWGRTSKPWSRQEGQEILRKHGIDPIFGKENLVWAPNKIEGQHAYPTLEKVVNKLKEVDAGGGGYDDMVDALKELGKSPREEGDR